MRATTLDGHRAVHAARTESRLVYEATLDDPQTYTRPWTIEMPLYRLIDQQAQLFEHKCVTFTDRLLYQDLLQNKNRGVGEYAGQSPSAKNQAPGDDASRQRPCCYWQSCGHWLPHHPFSAEFDATKQVTLEGEVVMMEWENPHSWLHIDVKKPDGSVERWKIEGGSPSVLMRLGWNRELTAGRHEGHGRRLPGEGRLPASQFTGPEVP